MTTTRDAPIVRDPARLGGEPAFAGTRVHARTLFEYLEEGQSIEGFLADFPDVSREQAVATLRAARERLLADTR